MSCPIYHKNISNIEGKLSIMMWGYSLSSLTSAKKIFTVDCVFVYWLNGCSLPHTNWCIKLLHWTETMPVFWDIQLSHYIHVCKGEFPIWKMFLVNYSQKMVSLATVAFPYLALSVERFTAHTDPSLNGNNFSHQIPPLCDAMLHACCHFWDARLRQ